MAYYGNMTDEQIVERIRKEADRAQRRYDRVRDEMLPKMGFQDYRTLDEVIYSDADLKVWRDVEYHLDIPWHVENYEPTATDRVARVRKVVRRQVQGYSMSRSSNAISNLMRAVEHDTWLEAAELLDPSW
jgi:hypothetical protein